MSLVSVHNEWDPIEEVIVGTAINAQLPKPDISVHAVDFPHCKTMADIPFGPFPAQMLAEAEEDLAGLVQTLEKLNITVRRPDVTNHAQMFATPDWQADSHYNYCPRDLVLAIGNTIIESPSPVRARYFEMNAYKKIFIDYMKSGAQWVSAPKPMLLDDCFAPPHGYDNCLLNAEPLFDAANILRIGEDILYLISNSGNQMGAMWLRTMLGSRYRVHECHNLYHHKHIDTTFTILRPGLVVINPERVNQENLPEIFKSWDKIWFDNIVDVGSVLEHPLSSQWIGMNFLVVRPDLAIIEERQVPLIKAVEKYGISVIPQRLRHPRAMGGGFHCATSDVRRTGTLERYV
jgi:N-dimethylarginine dimethylaminohydrolase